MKPKSRSSRSEVPARFEAFDDENPHDLMSRRKQNSEQSFKPDLKRSKLSRNRSKERIKSLWNLLKRKREIGKKKLRGKGSVGKSRKMKLSLR